MEQLSGRLSSDPGGGSGTRDYEKLENKPSINGIELLGQLSLKDLGIMSEEELQRLAEQMEGKIPKKVSELENDSTFQTEDQVDQKIQETEGKIPGKTSELENDSTFQTEEQVNQKIQETEGKIPGKTSELENDSTFQTEEQVEQKIQETEGKIWHKDEDITPQEAFTFGLEFAEKWFSGFQTVVAVHQDKEHIHCHFVTNSVSYENGKKYHSSKKDLEAMKQMTNKMCKEKGLTVAEKGKHFDGSDIEPGEVITWNKNKYQLFMKDTKQSFVWACAMAVINAVRNCFSKEEFISRMQESGWTVHWSDKRKHITFENKDGQKVRDSNLAKTFQLDIGKEELLNEFIRQRENAGKGEAELEQYYRQLEEFDSGAVRETGDRIIDQSRIIAAESKSARRESQSANTAVRDAETESETRQRERSAEEQKRIDAEKAARTTRKKNRRRSDPER